MLDIKPLHLFCVQEALAARIRLNSVLEFDWHGTSHTKTHAISHMKFLNDKLKQFKIDPSGSDRCSSLEWSTGFRVNWESFDGSSKHRRPAQVNVYTDGSKLEGQTGAGISIRKGGREILAEWCRLPDEATVFQAEVKAISRAAEILQGHRAEDAKYIKIFVDSQAAISAIGNPMVTSRTVASAIANLYITHQITSRFPASIYFYKRYLN